MGNYDLHLVRYDFGPHLGIFGIRCTTSIHRVEVVDHVQIQIMG
jgi:hypothetical protein